MTAVKSIRTVAPPRRDLNLLVGYQVRRVGAKIAKQLGHIFSVVGLAPGQFSVLMLIADSDGCQQSEIAQQTDLDPSTLVPVIDRLRGLGFVRREKHPHDRRAWLLYATPEGRAAIRKVTPQLSKFEDGLTAALSDRQKSELLASLKQIDAALGVAVTR